MKRRKFLESCAKSLLSVGIAPRLSLALEAARSDEERSEHSSSSPPQVLAGTAPLTQTGDLSFLMEDGIREFLRRRIQETPRDRALLWQRDYRSAIDYEKSVSAHRERFRHIIGAVDARVPPQAPEVLASPGETAEIAQGANYKVMEVRWPVFDPADEGLCGLHAEGLLLQPMGKELARIVALPDADWTPEMMVGLAPGVPPAAQFARRLAESGCQVLVPMLINREDTFSGNPHVKMTNEPHREWIYRMAFELGRHIIGYEVQKVLAAIDWFVATSQASRVPIGVMGYGEGGLIAFYSAALDSRIDATVVSGYFQERENLWKEPIYRNVWGLTRDFGDAEIASIIAPRVLIVEACRGPEVDGPPPATSGRPKVACQSGKLTTPSLDSVQREFDRAEKIFAALGVEQHIKLIARDDGRGHPGSEEALTALLSALSVPISSRPAGESPHSARKGVDPQSRLHSQLDEMVAYTQGLAQKSSERRDEFWSGADTSSPERWTASTKPMREFIWDEIFGRLPEPSVPMNARTRLVYDAPGFTGYEVTLDLWPEVFDYGILLLPKDMRAGERRPVVVCQHGLEARVQEVADPNFDSQFYRHFAVSLANLGFVTYSPQNAFLDGERFRLIQRMGQPLKIDMFSFVLSQHQRMLDWLVEQPYVDPKRIGFYGMSYGGKTAIRVPPLLDRYALTICSGDFNEIVWAMTSVSENSFMFDDSWDLYEFNFANVIDYSDLACLMIPRPFMAERGHSDGPLDEHAGFEFATVKRFYDKFGMGDRAAIEYFNGGHTINGKGTFEFLRKFLNLPTPGGGG